MIFNCLMYIEFHVCATLIARALLVGRHFVCICQLDRAHLALDLTKTKPPVGPTEAQSPWPYHWSSKALAIG